MAKRTIKMNIGHCDPGAVGTDEGGPYKLVEVEDVPKKLKARMARCAGCHDDFYNHRANCCGNHCWSLKEDEYFRGRGRPKCYH